MAAAPEWARNGPPVARTWADACSDAASTLRGSLTHQERGGGGRFRIAHSEMDGGCRYFPWKTATAVDAAVCAGGACLSNGCDRAVCAFDAALAALRSLDTALAIKAKKRRTDAVKEWNLADKRARSD